MKKKQHMWIISAFVRSRYSVDEYGDYNAFRVKVSEIDLQHAVTKACHIFDDTFKEPGTEIMISSAGLAADETGSEENEIHPDLLEDMDYEW